MTTDELLAKLDAEYCRLEAELSSAYETYGRVIYPAVQNTVSGVYSSDCAYERNQVKNRLSRMKEISERRCFIRREIERVTE